jgi:peptidoglycan/LPS O-acetylase OafA/YrhL
MRSAFGLHLLSNKFPALHGLRVLGILAVILLHFSTSLLVNGELSGHAAFQEVAKRTWFSMDLFFFLSGFLIGTILLAAPPDLTGARGVGRFYLRRSFRIFPAYYVVLTVLALIKPLDPLARAQLAREYCYLTNYSDVTHVVMIWGWSLCVEEHFYLAIPAIILGLRLIPWHGVRILGLVALWFSGVVVRGYIVSVNPPISGVDTFEKLNIPTHARYDSLMAGVLLAYLLMTEEKRLRALMANSWARASALVLSLGLFAFFLSDFNVLVPLYIQIGTLTGIALMILFIYLVCSEGWLSRALGNRIFLFLGTLGYGVYLVHYPIVYALGPGLFRYSTALGVPFAVAYFGGVLAMFAASLPVAYLLHLIVEKPSLLARDRLVPAN